MRRRHQISPGAAVETARRGPEGARATGSPPPLPAGVKPLDAPGRHLLLLLVQGGRSTPWIHARSWPDGPSMEEIRLRLAQLRRDGYVHRVGWDHPYGGRAVWAPTAAGLDALARYRGRPI